MPVAPPKRPKGEVAVFIGHERDTGRYFFGDVYRKENPDHQALHRHMIQWASNPNNKEAAVVSSRGQFTVVAYNNTIYYVQRRYYKFPKWWNERVKAFSRKLGLDPEQYGHRLDAISGVPESVFLPIYEVEKEIRAKVTALGRDLMSRYPGEFKSPTAWLPAMRARLQVDSIRATADLRWSAESLTKQVSLPDGADELITLIQAMYEECDTYLAVANRLKPFFA